jgi:hypothetical protein
MCLRFNAPAVIDGKEGIKRVGAEATERAQQ